MTHRVSTAGREGRRGRTALVLSLALALFLTACGSDDDSPSAGSTGGTGDSTAGTASGEPIKVMTMTSLNSQGPVFPNIAETAEVYTSWINDQGGINGRPIKLSICDDEGQPTAAAACARQAVQDEVVAAVGSYTFFADGVIPVLEPADTAWFGVCCPGTAAELSSDVSFPIGSGLMYAVGMVQHAVDEGCESISAAVIDGAQPYIPPMENAMEALGRSFERDPVILPATAQDYSPFVAQATGGADCVLVVLSESLWVPWWTAYAQSGSDTKVYGPQGNLSEPVIEGFEEAAEGSVVAGVYPDLSLSPWEDYRAALEEYDADPEYDYNSLAGMGTWAAFEAFTQIVEGMEGDITASSFLEAASGTSDLDLNGMVPPLDFTQPWTDGLEGFPRLFNRSVIFQQVEDGQVVPLTEEFQDVGELAKGEAP